MQYYGDVNKYYCGGRRHCLDRSLSAPSVTRKHHRKDETHHSHYRLRANSLLVPNYANKRKKMIFGCKCVVFHNKLARNGKVLKQCFNSLLAEETEM